MLRTQFLSALTVVVFSTSAAYASVPDAAGVIHGCRKSNGQTRIIDTDTATCEGSETPLPWSQQGPQGPTGATGPQGAPGLQGATGPQGPVGPIGGPRIPPEGKILWLNHFEFLPGDPTVTTSSRALTSDVGGLTGLNIHSSTTGEDGSPAGNKVVQQAVGVPPGFLVIGVRLCYQLSSANSFVSQIRLAQVQDPPSVALVLLDDATDLTAVGPVCVDSSPTLIDPTLGSLLFSLRVNFGDTSDAIVIRAVGLRLVNAP